LDLLEKYKFKNYPFPISPVEEPTFWADLEKVKQKLIQFLSFAISIPASTSVLLWGWRGAGKTYSMYYFTKIEQLKELIEEKKIKLITIRLPISIYIIKESYKALYLSIIEGVRSNLKEHLRMISKKYRKEGIQPKGALKRKFKRELTKFARNETIQDVISEWLESLIVGRTTDEEELFKILKLKPRGKLTEYDIQEIISALFNFITNSESFKEIMEINQIKIILWIDEWECIRDIRLVESNKINDFLRFLMDYIPFYLTLLINITLRPDERLEDISGYFSYQFLDRIGQYIEFPPLTEEDAFQYVSQRISYNLHDKEKSPYPFTEDSIREVIEILLSTNKPLLPRALNRVFSSILFDAFYKDIEVIDVEFIRKREEMIKALL